MSAKDSRPPYVYEKNGAWWYVYKIIYVGKSSYGEKLPEPLTQEEAKIKTYQLNGWELNK